MSNTFSTSQADRHPPQGSTASQEASAVPANSTPSWESLSKEGNSLTFQAGSQSGTSQAVHSTPSWESPFQAGSQSGTSQAVHSLVTSQACRQGSSLIPRDSTTSKEASASQAGRQGSGDSATFQEASTSQAVRQANAPFPGTALLSRKLASPRQAGRLVPHLPGGQCFFPRKLVPPPTTFLPGKVFPRQATTPYR